MIEEIIQTLTTTNYLIAIVVLLIINFKPPLKFFKKYRKKNVPGPLPLPLIGTQYLFPLKGYKFEKLHEYYEDMHKKYGKIMKEEALFNVPVINIFNKEDIEKVLRINSKYPLRPPTEAVAYYRKTRPDRYASTGLVNEQGPTWHNLRTTLTPTLTSPKTISNFLPEAQDIADDFCYLIKSLRDSKFLIENLEEVTGKLGLEISCDLVLGRRMGFLMPGDESGIANELAENISEHFIATRDTYFGFPTWKLFKTKPYSRLIKSEEKIYDLALNLIKTADDSVKESAVFQSVITADIDEKEKIAAVVDFIAAGIHTLKNSFLFVLYMLAEHPEYQIKILENKQYLKACMLETFRLLPTANGLARITEESLQLSGYDIEPGNVIVCHTGIACRDEANFKNPNDFIPERWFEDGYNDKMNYILVPFGAGKRICPGKRFVEQVLPILIENVCRNFNVQIIDKLELQFEFLLTPKGPVRMLFKDR